MPLPAIPWTHVAPAAEIIRRRTLPDPGDGYEVRLPPPADPERCEVLVVGDTGDAEGHRPGESPVEAVAAFMAKDAALPGSPGRAEAVLHTGDLVYKTGEARLYERNFVRPFARFLAPGVPARPLRFRLPFLPVPGNHDYHELAAWGRSVIGAAVLGPALRRASWAALRYAPPLGGSGVGEAWAAAFLAPAAEGGGADGTAGLPNRYYRFRLGAADFFALDSNTLQAGPEAGEDHDAVQLAWLEEALAASVRERPDAWRVVYLHHPLHTTQRTYCEGSGVTGVRRRLAPLLRGRVHLVLSGHAHLFEWLRSDAVPGTALVVTGGGGQPTLGRTVLAAGEAGLLRRLRDAGVTECAVAGRAAAPDGRNGPLYHYLRLTITRAALSLEPVGVRRLRSGSWRRERPVPAIHRAFDAGAAVQRPLLRLVVRRDGEVRPCWDALEGA